LLFIVAATAALGACASRGPSDAPPAQAAPAKQADADEDKPDPDNAIFGNPPRGSLFSKVALGMPLKQVVDLIGPPTDQKFYPTGKAFIPFYHGPDRARTEYRYKGQGVITFNESGGWGGGTFVVYRVQYDPKESGYAH
jgi:predicted small lipoprotein YifL